ncbi:hypothetical protein BGZ96_001314 [Linnemannia gamsii]|uniref:Uncharacterized protein n=1 Tax=Linnemannia gamsii TaxID=64522 RepID=A0ABQ7JML5_9FUNG|nr:hypothetical protein BGZ96_001314 [Linnemannia gamsii]
MRASLRVRLTTISMVVILITTLVFKNTAHAAPAPAPVTASAVDAIPPEEHPRSYINAVLARHADDAALLAAATEETEDEQHDIWSRWRRRADDAALLAATMEPEDVHIHMGRWRRRDVETNVEASAAPRAATEEPEDRSGFLSRWRRRDFDFDKPEVYADASSEGHVDYFRPRR